MQREAMLRLFNYIVIVSFHLNKGGDKRTLLFVR